MSGLAPYDMFEFQVNGMSEAAVRECWGAFTNTIRLLLSHIQTHPIFSQLDDTSYSKKQLDVMEAFQDLKTMLNLFNERYRDFKRAKYRKARELLRQVLCAGADIGPKKMIFVDICPTFSSYLQFSHDYGVLLKSIYDHIDTCQWKIGHMVGFNELTPSLYDEGNVDLRVLAQALRNKIDDFFRLVLGYHTTKNDGDFKRFASIKREYDRKMEEMVTFIQGVEDWFGILQGDIEHREHCLNVIKEKVSQKGYYKHTLSQLGRFESQVKMLGIPLNVLASEIWQEAWGHKITSHLESLRIKSEDRYRTEVRLKAREFNSHHLQFDNIPRPQGPSLDIVNQIGLVGNKIRSHTSRWLKLETENELIQHKISQLTQLAKQESAQN